MVAEKEKAYEAGATAELVSNSSQDPAAATIRLAHAVDDAQLSPWTPSMFRLYAVLAVAYLCGCLVRYSIAVLL